MLTPRPASVTGVYPTGREPPDHRKWSYCPICHIQAIDITVPGAAPPVTAYRLYSVDLDDWGTPMDYPTFWKVKAVLIFHARPAVRAPICVCM